MPTQSPKKFFEYISNHLVSLVELSSLREAVCNRSYLNRKILYENFDGLNVPICLKVVLNGV